MAIKAARGAFDRLTDEPGLYGDADLVEPFRSDGNSRGVS
jgi:hypothetical protein